MYCVECGAKLQEGASFCAHCGRRVENSSAVKETADSTPVAKPKRYDGPSKLVMEKTGVPRWFLAAGIAELVVGVLMMIGELPTLFQIMSMNRYYRSSYMSSLVWAIFSIIVGLILIAIGILWIKASVTMKTNEVKVYTDRVQLQYEDSPLASNQVLKYVFVGGSTRSVNVVVMYSDISVVSCSKSGVLRALEIELKGGNKHRVLINDAEEISNAIHQQIYGN